MNQIDVSSWEECLERFRALEDEHIKRREQAPGHVSPFLYRGQPCSDWGLTTTLERSSRGNLSLLQYYRLISAVRPHIEAPYRAGVESPVPA